MKNVLVTGAGGGLGQAVVQSLLALDYEVIATDLNLSCLESSSHNPNLRKYEVDVTNDEAIRNLSSEMKLKQTGLDVLICLAGIYDTFPVTETNPEKFRQVIAVNFLGTASIINLTLKPLINKQGRVIVVSSESYKLQAMFQPYMISKAALEAYCRVAWQELALKNVSLSVIRPGAFKTPLLKWMEKEAELENPSLYKEEFLASLAQSKKMVGKIISPEKVAEIVVKAATASKPKRYYHVNNNPLLSLISLLPANLIDRLIVNRFKRNS